MRNVRAAGLLFLALGMLAPAAARATYSIVATDRVTRQVGGAVTSCVGGSVAGVYGSAPGLGAVASQAASNANGRNRAVQRLMMNVPPDQIITELRSAAFDQNSASRQYGVVDMMGRAAGHSGASNSAFSADIQGQAGDLTYSVQGNILTGRAVLTQTEAAFRGEACDLAERLMRALEAGANNNQGDNRCTGRFGTPSHSAFIEVDRPGEPQGSYLRLSVVPQQMSANPLPGLRAAFNDWRRTHPCPDGTPDPTPIPPDASSDAGTPARDAGAGRLDTARPAPLDAGGSGGGGGSTPRPVDSGAGQGAGGAGGSGAPGGAAGASGGPPAPTAGTPGSGGPAPTAGATGTPPTAGAPAPQTPAAMPAGCECHAAGMGSPGLLSLLLATAWLFARRRRRA